MMPESAVRLKTLGSVMATSLPAKEGPSRVLKGFQIFKF